jgi:hypothetical protein
VTCLFPRSFAIWGEKCVLRFGVRSFGYSSFLLACAFTRRKLCLFFLDTLWPRFYQRSVKVHNKCEWLTYFRLLAPSVAAQLSGCFVLLDAGPYRLEGGGVRTRFILPLGFKRPKVVGRIRGCGG